MSRRGHSVRAALGTHGIAAAFEIYPGTHTSRVADRFQDQVLPFFSRNPCVRTPCP